MKVLAGMTYLVSGTANGAADMRNRLSAGGYFRRVSEMAIVLFGC